MTDEDYKISTCPSRATVCGRKEFNLKDPNEGANVTITGMFKGDVCNYVVKVTSQENSLPAFEVSGLNGRNVRDYYIKYFEFDDTSNDG